MSKNNLFVDINSITIAVPHNLKTIVDEIYMNFSDKNFKLDIISTQYGISYSHIYEMFIQYFNICPSKFLENVRLEFTLKHLNDGITNIGLLSSKTGFGCSRTLRNVFKRRFVFSPTVCRKQLKNNKNNDFKLENLINKIWE